MNYPEYVEVECKRYKINTDFKIALECNRIAEDDIDDRERALAIIYMLYGDEGLDNPNHYVKLLELAKKYLSCGKEIEDLEDKEPDMDFFEDWDYIEASFQSDYKIDLSNTKMHWWKFFKLMDGLSNSELGNCCVLNRVRNLRNYDVSEIKDKKLKEEILKAKKSVALHKNKKKVELSEKEKTSAMNFLSHFRKE
ncbi:MAG: Gp15 family bacteriophage protein [Methanosphaera sp.]|nr:Gp15 family bacteriophage protein [Methanosphaera sp.]